MPWRTEDDIEGVDRLTWYNDTFKDIERKKAKPRGPPMWLAGPRWYDRREDER